MLESTFEKKVQDEILKVVNIVVIYPNGVVANNGVTLSIRRGEVLGLLGENGAGKTTLMKVISGRLKPVQGKIYFEGKEVHFKSPRDALQLGIAIAPQHPQLFGGLTVLEDIGLSLRLAGINVRKNELRTKILKISKKYGLNINPDITIWKLSMGERQKVDLLRTILLNAKIIILDEPTTHLAPVEIEKLISIVRALAREGRSVIFITHKLKEALAASDRIAVMRNGKVVGILRKDEANEETLLKLMFGSKVSLEGILTRTKRTLISKKVLEVIDLWVRGPHGTWSVKGATFDVNVGEIVGVAGIAGNGQKELFEALVGIRKASKGMILIKGTDVTKKPPITRRSLGLAIIPEERLGWALVPKKDIIYNIALSLAFMNGSLWMNWSRYKDLAEKIVKAFDIKLKHVKDRVESLSGGNMQKLIIARELARKADIIIAMNPTAGLDFKAALFVRKSLIDAKEKGAAILIISEDLEELLELSDRIYVINRGKFMGPYVRPFNIKEIAKAMVY
jgi:ABC-type uncharacterized transport system ATPase subunit